MHRISGVIAILVLCGVFGGAYAACNSTEVTNMEFTYSNTTGGVTTTQTYQFFNGTLYYIVSTYNLTGGANCTVTYGPITYSSSVFNLSGVATEFNTSLSSTITANVLSSVCSPSNATAPAVSGAACPSTNPVLFGNFTSGTCTNAIITGSLANQTNGYCGGNLSDYAGEIFTVSASPANPPTSVPPTTVAATTVAPTTATPLSCMVSGMEFSYSAYGSTYEWIFTSGGTATFLSQFTSATTNCSSVYGPFTISNITNNGTYWSVNFTTPYVLSSSQCNTTVTSAPTNVTSTPAPTPPPPSCYQVSGHFLGSCNYAAISTVYSYPFPSIGCESAASGNYSAAMAPPPPPPPPPPTTVAATTAAPPPPPATSAASPPPPPPSPPTGSGSGTTPPATTKHHSGAVLLAASLAMVFLVLAALL